MHDEKWERVSAWGGVAAVICFVVSTAISGKTNPGKVAQFNPAEVARAYTKSHNGIRAGAFIFGLGVIFLLWWFATLWGMMRRAEGGAPRLTVMAGLGLIMAGTLQLLHLTLDSAIAWRTQDLGSSIVTVAAMSTAVSGASTFGLVALLGAVSAVAIRTKFLPAWLAWGGVVIGLVWLVSALSVSTFNGIAGVGAIAYVLWAVWILGISWTIWRAPSQTAGA
jgi:hypothetical protein